MLKLLRYINATHFYFKLYICIMLLLNKVKFVCQIQLYNYIIPSIKINKKKNKSILIKLFISLFKILRNHRNPLF